MPFENPALSLICRLCLVTPSGDSKGSGQLKHRPAPRAAFPPALMHPRGSAVLCWWQRGDREESPPCLSPLSIPPSHQTVGSSPFSLSIEIISVCVFSFGKHHSGKVKTWWGTWRHWDADTLFLALNTQARYTSEGRTDFVCVSGQEEASRGTVWTPGCYRWQKRLVIGGSPAGSRRGYPCWLSGRGGWIRVRPRLAAERRWNGTPLPLLQRGHEWQMNRRWWRWIG